MGPETGSLVWETRLHRRHWVPSLILMLQKPRGQGQASRRLWATLTLYRHSACLKLNQNKCWVFILRRFRAIKTIFIVSKSNTSISQFLIANSSLYPLRINTVKPEPDDFEQKYAKKHFKPVESGEIIKQVSPFPKPQRTFHSHWTTLLILTQINVKTVILFTSITVLLWIKKKNSLGKK